MKPSASSPVVLRAFGPYAAIHTGTSAPGLIQGKRTTVPPPRSASSPLPSARMTLMASLMRARVLGLRPATRIAESPRPMPQTVRLPNMSLRVAKVEAVTSQVRVPGLVTIGPTLSFEVWARIWL